MNRKAITLGVAGVMMLAATGPVEAGSRSRDRAVAAVAGFVGGVLVANAAQSAQTYQTASYHGVASQDTRAVCPSVGRQETIVFEQTPRRVVHYNEPLPRGHYEWRLVRVWVPGYWYWEPARGRVQRQVWQPGLYETRREKVWISYASNRRW